MFSRIFTFLALASALCLSCTISADEKLHVQTFKGHEIDPYTKDIIQLSNKIYRTYPYFYAGSDANYTAHLESYAKKNSIVCVAFDGDKVIGFAAGMPMEEVWDKYQKPLLKNGVDITKGFYIGELIILPEYAGSGLGMKMGLEIEKFVKDTNRFSTIYVTKINPSTLSQPAPADYVSSEDEIHLKKLGFQKRPELSFQSNWTNVNETKESSHTMEYWSKSLK